MTQREIAKGLGLTPQRVGQLVTKGMPTTSMRPGRGVSATSTQPAHGGIPPSC